MLKKYSKAHVFTLTVALTIALTGMFVISSCGTTSVTPSEAYGAGQTIGRIIRGE